MLTTEISAPWWQMCARQVPRGTGGVNVRHGTPPLPKNKRCGTKNIGNTNTNTNDIIKHVIQGVIQDIEGRALHFN